MNADDSVIASNVVRAERTRLYREQIEQDRDQRIVEHQTAIAELGNLAPGQPRPVNIYADGDSWFDYPLPILNPKDVIVSLIEMGVPKPTILNLAHYGDEARDKLGVSQRKRIIQNLSDPANGGFEAVLFSGGGNDTVGEQFCLWINDSDGVISPTQALNVERLAAVLGVVRSAYEDLISICKKHAPAATVFFHAYDFAIPTGQGVCSIGPWLAPSLEFHGWNKHDGTLIVREFLLQFDKMLQKIEATYPGVVYVRAQGTLNEDDWANELHPTRNGFDAIAKHFHAELRKKFPGRI